MSNRDTVISRAFDAVEKLTVRSALNPILWLCGLVTIPSLVVSSIVATTPVWLIWLAFMPVVAVLLGFLFLLVVDRDKLQSESYQLRKQALELIEQKGDIAAIPSTTIEVISNPEYVAITMDKPEGQK
jgi:hypothetical protein